MRVRTDSTGERHLVELAGRFDAHEIERFRLVVDPLVGDRGATVTVDLADVVFIDSSALAELVRARKSARAAGGDLTITRMSTPVRVILELTALDTVLVAEADRSRP